MTHYSFGPDIEPTNDFVEIRGDSPIRVLHVQGEDEWWGWIASCCFTGKTLATSAERFATNKECMADWNRLRSAKLFENVAGRLKKRTV